MDDVTALRDALLAKLTSDWDFDPYGEHEAAVMRLRADLDALIAAAQQEARAGLVEALADIYYRLESAIGNLDGAPEQVVQDVYLTFKAAERAAERAGIIGPDIVASVLDVGATERCAECGHELRWHMDGACACEGDGVGHPGDHQYPDDDDIPPAESMEQEVTRLRSENARLRDVLRTLAGEQFCVATSGGTEGKWCCNHDDFPMVGETDCALMQRVWETLGLTGGPK